MTLKTRNGGIDVAHHDGREEVLFAREPGIDRRLPRPRQGSDLFHTCTVQPTSEKYTTGGIEDPRLYFSGALARGPAGSDGAALVEGLFSRCNSCHQRRSSRCRDCSTMPQAQPRNAAPTALI